MWTKNLVACALWDKKWRGSRYRTNEVKIELACIQRVVVVRPKHTPIIHPAHKVDAVPLPVRLVTAGSRRRTLAAVRLAVDDLFAGHVHSVEAPAGVELLDHLKEIVLAQPAFVKLHEFVEGAGVDKAARGDGADVFDVALRVGFGEVAQSLKLGVHAQCVKGVCRR